MFGKTNATTSSAARLWDESFPPPHNCRPVHGANIIIKVADDTIVSDLIKDNYESASREEVESLDDGWNQSSAADEEDRGVYLILQMTSKMQYVYCRFAFCRIKVRTVKPHFANMLTFT